MARTRGKRYNKGATIGHKTEKSSGAASMFQMNTEIGQHVLKNPGVSQAIVDKAELKQSDVRITAQMRTVVPL